MDSRERYNHPDQWKHYGRCAVCRRKNYCKTQCTANRNYAAVALREFMRKTKLGRMTEAMEAAMKGEGIEQES